MELETYDIFGSDSGPRYKSVRTCYRPHKFIWNDINVGNMETEDIYAVIKEIESDNKLLSESIYGVKRATWLDIFNQELTNRFTI